MPVNAIVLFGLFLLCAVNPRQLAAQEYTYDTNGNLTVDTNKGIASIAYNLLNLPKTILYEDGRKIEYTYTASGKKLSQKAYNIDGTLVQNKAYANGLVYTNDNLEFLHHSYGYSEFDGTESFDYVYQHTDHLGNIRLAFADENHDGFIADTEIRKQKDYYPFGLIHEKENNIIRGRDHPYGFGGKEEQAVFELDWHDFEARMYDGALGRWHVMDPMAEKFTFLSPYAYVANNPIKYIDPDGRQQRLPPPNPKTLKQVSNLIQKISKIPVVGPVAARIIAPLVITGAIGMDTMKKVGRPLPGRVVVPSSTISALSIAAGVSYPIAMQKAKEADARKAKEAAQENPAVTPQLEVIQGGGGGDDGDDFKTTFVVTRRGEYVVTRNTIELSRRIIIGYPSLIEARNSAIKKRKDNTDTFIVQVDATNWKHIKPPESPENPGVYVNITGNIRINEVLQVKEMGYWDIPIQSTINAMK